MCTFMVGPISPPGIEKSAGSIIHFWIRCALEVALLLYLEIKQMKKELDKNNNELTQLRKYHYIMAVHCLFVYFFLNSINDRLIKVDYLFHSALHIWPLHHIQSFTSLLVYFILHYIYDCYIIYSHLLVYLFILFWITYMTATSYTVIY